MFEGITFVAKIANLSMVISELLNSKVKGGVLRDHLGSGLNYLIDTPCHGMTASSIIAFSERNIHNFAKKNIWRRSGLQDLYNGSNLKIIIHKINV